jgi:uroporphyrinogen-III synthase
MLKLKNKGSVLRWASGRRIILTRESGYNEELAESLSELGLTTLEHPLLRRHYKILDENIFVDLDDHYDCMFLSSSYATSRLLEIVDVERIRNIPKVVVGEASKSLLTEYGLDDDKISIKGASRYWADEVNLNPEDWRGLRCLMLGAEIMRPEFKEALANAGAIVDSYPLYYTESVEWNEIQWNALYSELELGIQHYICFFSPSAVQSWLAHELEARKYCRTILRLPGSISDYENVPQVLPLAIGPSTAEAIWRYFRLDAPVVEPHNTDGFVEYLAKCALQS